jgi:hypothetical protein
MPAIPTCAAGKGGQKTAQLAMSDFAFGEED